MKWPFSRKDDDNVPGLVGRARLDTSVVKVLRKAEAGDIVILHEPDLTQAAAEELIAAGVLGVVNTAPALSDNYPTYGTLVLLQAGIAVLDRAPSTLYTDLKDGKKISLDGGKVWKNGSVIADAHAVTLEEISTQIESARQRVNDELSAFAGNTAEFLSTESPLLLEGMGVPDITCDMAGRTVLVVSGGQGTTAELQNLRWFISHNSPVFIGVEAGAATLLEAGYTPDIVVGDPRKLSNDVLRCGAELILPADPDGHVEGVERVEELALSATTFPAVAGAHDLALLLADYGNAALIVTAGSTMTLGKFLGAGEMRDAAPSFLTRLKVADRIVSARALHDVGPSRGVNVWAVILALLSLLFAAGTVYLYGFPQSAVAGQMIDMWNHFVATIHGWLHI